MSTVRKEAILQKCLNSLIIVAMITVHFNYAKRRFDILKLLSM